MVRDIRWTAPGSATMTDWKTATGINRISQRDSAMTIFDDPITAQTVPDANMRAALASLIGTIGEPVRRYF